MLRIDEKFVSDWIEGFGGLDEIDEATKQIREYMEKDWYDSKQELMDKWEISHGELHELIISIFTVTLKNTTVTMQAMVGMLNHKIKLPDEIERIKIIADCIGIISLTGLIDIISEQGEYHKISTEYDCPGIIPKEDKHPVHFEPEPVKGNWDKGGRSSMLLGHKMNHHNEYLCLAHLELLGNVPFTINQEFIRTYEEAPKNDPYEVLRGSDYDPGKKYPGWVRTELNEHTLSIQDAIIAWEAHQEKAMEKYLEIGAGGVFYQGVKYCYRGRTYSDEYYTSYQGSSFKKAIVELANAEIVEGF